MSPLAASSFQAHVGMEDACKGGANKGGWEMFGAMALAPGECRRLMRDGVQLVRERPRRAG